MSKTDKEELDFVHKSTGIVAGFGTFFVFIIGTVVNILLSEEEQISKERFEDSHLIELDTRTIIETPPEIVKQQKPATNNTSDNSLSAVKDDQKSRPFNIEIVTEEKYNEQVGRYEAYRKDLDSNRPKPITLDGEENEAN
ncbi:hypothetical protein NF212_21825 [Parasalinivibrio latis]|uniref:hypothetical protein n=1 Tax=Parasalinivibrio latis TaxID=2952610 RepID=UPI0030E28E08